MFFLRSASTHAEVLFQLLFVPPLLLMTLPTVFPTLVPTHDNMVRDAPTSSFAPPTSMNESPGDATILASRELEIQVLEHAMNLRKVVEQLEQGDMQQIH